MSAAGDTPLTAEQVAELRGELERELARLERSMQGTREASKPAVLDQSAIGRLSRIDAIQNQQLTAGLHERELARHAQLLDALARIDAGTYGRCLTCGRPIAYGRLLVFPEARTCPGCERR